MTVNVTELPVGVPTSWDLSRAPIGTPFGELIFQNDQVDVPPATAEQIAITISGALPIGYAYRLMDAFVSLDGAAENDIDQFTRQAELRLLGFNPNSPNVSQLLKIGLSADPVGLANATTGPNVVNASALPWKLMWGGHDNLPNTILTANAATQFMISLATTNNTNTGTSELGYYVRFLQYTIEEDFTWAMHSPVPVTG